MAPASHLQASQARRTRKRTSHVTIWSVRVTHWSRCLVRCPAIVKSLTLMTSSIALRTMVLSSKNWSRFSKSLAKKVVHANWTKLGSVFSWLHVSLPWIYFSLLAQDSRQLESSCAEQPTGSFSWHSWSHVWPLLSLQSELIRQNRSLRSSTKSIT